jgi:hypothetical protein
MLFTERTVSLKVFTTPTSSLIVAAFSDSFVLLTIEEDDRDTSSADNLRLEDEEVEVDRRNGVGGNDGGNDGLAKLDAASGSKLDIVSA